VAIASADGQSSQPVCTRITSLHEQMAMVSPGSRRATALTGRRDERDVLDRLLETVGAGESRALVVRGEPGVGKTALLDYLVEHAPGFRVVRAAGVQSEMELAYAGLHQLLASMLDRLDDLPVPQSEALRTVFGFSSGRAPDRFFVGLAVLSLLSDVADEQPLVCVVDDEQWLDRASADVLAFVARRLDRESVGLIFAARAASDQLAGLPELVVVGLSEADAGALLDSILTAPLDPGVREQIVSETRGIPLAMLELLRDLTPAELAGGFGLAGGVRVSGSVEETFRRRIDALPSDSRRLLQLAAADPIGDPLLVWRAAERLGVSTDAATAPAQAGLLEFGARVRFRHPLVRSAAYWSASLQERQEAHRALAGMTDPELDPDRHAWHRAHAAAGPDEDVAEELDRSAARAQARGGLAAAAAFLERSAELTLEPVRRGQRLLAAARAKRDAGAFEAALELLVTLEAEQLGSYATAEAEHLRGQIAFEQQRGSDAARLLLSAARRLTPLDAPLARETQLEALLAALWAGDLDRPGGVLAAAEAARAAPAGPEPPRAVDVVLDALAIRLTDGYGAGAPLLSRALELLLAQEMGSDEVGRSLWLAASRSIQVIAPELWNADAVHTLATRQLEVAREAGALVQLRLALNFLGGTLVFSGELAKAELLFDEDRLVAEATGNQPVLYNDVLVAVWRGQEAKATELLEATRRQASAREMGRFVTNLTYLESVLSNARGRYESAREAARQAFEREHIGFGSLIVPELAEAASRTGDAALLRTALDWLTERAHVTPTEWARGIEARVRALSSDGEAAEALYREALERLGRTRLRIELARTHLLYGEWLRREHRRVDAREQLRTAHEMLSTMGVDAFADRAQRELLATGETVRKRRVETRGDLTAQEAQIARLARDGLSNPEIGAQLFISPRTVQYHLRKVFLKLGINSRAELERVLPGDPAAPSP
jgi:DNA-binding CsgD family transcriptional regulator